jgi:4-diphosphocytidyl-2-C-methyl-D-erythritol kinase
MLVFPPAKINIGLQITQKRDDGYHDLISVFYPIALCDVLEILVDESAPTGSVKFHPSGLAVDGNPDNNLVLKAIRLFHSRHPLPGLNVYLHKVIPMGAGLGGGSSDATYTLLALNEMMGLPFKYYPLLQMALQLGSDCPFFMRNWACLVEGRGEMFRELDLELSGYHLALINPGVHVSTAEAFAMIKPKQPDFDLKDMEELPPEEWQARVVNDFEGPVMQKFPEIRAALHVLNDAGAVYASMSGSGSTVYGLFRSKPELPQLPGHWMTFEQELVS